MIEFPGIIRPPKDATIIRAFGDEMVLHLGVEDTGGKFSMWTNITPPGGGPPPHYHENEDELFWPLSGAVNFLKGDEWIEVPPKTVIFMPRGTIHTFRNPNNEPLHMLIQTMPGGFERFFQECGNEFAKCGQPDMEKIVAISARYGIHYIQE